MCEAQRRRLDSFSAPLRWIPVGMMILPMMHIGKFDTQTVSGKTPSSYLIYREFSPYANFITANFVTAVFQNYYYNFANVILWAIYFVSAFLC